MKLNLLLLFRTLKGSQIDIAVLDFSKPFDTIHHDGLLSKLIKLRHRQEYLAMDF